MAAVPAVVMPPVMMVPAMAMPRTHFGRRIGLGGILWDAGQPEAEGMVFRPPGKSRRR
jgi:hypothetical protein